MVDGTNTVPYLQRGVLGDDSRITVTYSAPTESGRIRDRNYETLYSGFGRKGFTCDACHHSRFVRADEARGAVPYGIVPSAALGQVRILTKR